VRASILAALESLHPISQLLGPIDLGWTFKIRAENKEGFTQFYIFTHFLPFIYFQNIFFTIL